MPTLEHPPLEAGQTPIDEPVESITSDSDGGVETDDLEELDDPTTQQLRHEVAAHVRQERLARWSHAIGNVLVKATLPRRVRIWVGDKTALRPRPLEGAGPLAEKSGEEAPESPPQDRRGETPEEPPVDDEAAPAADETAETAPGDDTDPPTEAGGGGSPPEEPPDPAAPPGPEEPDDFGEWTADGKFKLKDDPGRLAARLHIPAEVITAAAERGIHPDYLIQARDNPFVGRHLREQGIEWGAEEPAPEEAEREVTARPEHPFWPLNRQGQARGEEAVELTREIGENPLKVRRSLRRISPPIPIIRNLHRRVLAWRMFEHHKATRPKTVPMRQSDGSVIEEKALYDDGRFGGGSKKRRGYRRFIRDVENDILVERSKLHPLNSGELKALKSDRRILAERLLKLRSFRRGIRQGRVVPEEFYDHHRFEAAVKEREGHPDEPLDEGQEW